MNIRTILVPTDFSPDAAEALATAVEFAKLFDAKIVIAHAFHVTVAVATPIGGGYSLPAGFYEDIRNDANQRVQKLAAEVSGQGVSATGIALSEPASLAIVNEAERLPADLIVMGTRGLTGVKHVVLGSVAERVVRGAPCPVLTVKASN